jgi:hypothetical protein
VIVLPAMIVMNDYISLMVDWQEAAAALAGGDS